MDIYQACEEAYKNGYQNGRYAAFSDSLELATRVKVAYEQLGKCHTAICRNFQDVRSPDSIEEDIREVLNKLLSQMTFFH